MQLSRQVLPYRRTIDDTLDNTLAEVVAEGLESTSREINMGSITVARLALV